MKDRRKGQFLWTKQGEIFHSSATAKLGSALGAGEVPRLGLDAASPHGWVPLAFFVEFFVCLETTGASPTISDVMLSSLQPLQLQFQATATLGFTPTLTWR